MQTTIAEPAAPVVGVRVDLGQATAQNTLGAGFDTLSNIENLRGSALVDLLIGDGNANILDGGAEADTLRGLGGDDIYLVDNIGDVIQEAVGAGTDLVRATVSFSLAGNVENLTLLGIADLDGTGNSLANLLTGNSGNNVLDGRAGIDTMTGLSGNDTYYVGTVGDIVQEGVNAGIDTVHASYAYTLTSNVENLVIDGTGNFSGTGNELANTLTGNSGNNSLNGLGGSDIIQAGDGGDWLRGGLGKDFLYGGVDASTDYFIFDDIAESTVGATRDQINDFVSGTDKIDLRGIDANAAAANNQAFAFSATGAAANSVWVVDIGSHLVIMGDVTGDTTADFQVQIMNINSIVSTDILL